LCTCFLFFKKKKKYLFIYLFIYYRKVLANLLGCSQRIDWRACDLGEDQERSDADKFRKAFQPYDPLTDEI